MFEEENRSAICSLCTAELVVEDADWVEIEVDSMFDDAPACTAATHGPRSTTCTCEDSKDE